MYVSNRGVSKYTPHFYKGISRWFYAIKFNSFTFSADSSKHLCAEKIYLLTFSADLQILCTPVTKDFLIPPHFYKGIQKHFYHPNFSPFTNCLQTKKEHLSLLLPIQRHFERRFFDFFTFITGKEKSPSLYKGLQKHYDHLKIILFTNCLHSNPHTIERRQS